MTTKVLKGESLLDIATRMGNASALVELALLNGLGITEDVPAGTLLQLPVVPVKKNTTYNSFVQPPAAKPVVVLKKQTLADIAVQYLGDVERVQEVATLNGISVTEDLLPGTELLLPPADTRRQRLVSLFSNPALAPACAWKEPTVDGVVQEGIGYWIIQYDFKVS